VTATVYEFGDFTVDCDGSELRRAGRILKLEKKPMELLILLVERNGDLVTRAEIAERLWGREVFVDTEHGINTAIRKIRQVLRDDPERPRFVQTITGKGYRFVAGVLVCRKLTDAHAVNGNNVVSVVRDEVSDSASQHLPDAAIASSVQPTRRRSGWIIAASICAVLAMTGVAVHSFFRTQPREVTQPPEVRYTQLTDFTDSAIAPALSLDGRMVAFFRGNSSFGTADQIYIKMLPNGEAKRLTDDRRLKYNLAFSPDGSQIAYTVLVHPGWATYTVSVLGGDPHLFLDNAAGLTWLDQHQLLFSAIRTGLHMGVVTGTATRENFRELYFPAHERGMAHYSYASPDRKFALVVEMDGKGDWAPCRLISLDGRRETQMVGPNGACTSAGWSPDGSWMYFTAVLKGQSHLWRQRFPNEKPEQITFGPTEESGVAVERDGRSIITSVGAHESAIWIHDARGDRCLSSEGEIVTYPPPSFSADGTTLYYLLRHLPTDSGPELWRMAVDSGKSEAVFPGISMRAFDISPDGKEVVYSSVTPGGESELWIAPIDRNSPAKRVGQSAEMSPHFGPHGEILFLRAEGRVNYLERMNTDGSGRSKVAQYPIGFVEGISPGRRWVMAIAPVPDGGGVAPIAVPVGGGPPRRMFAGYTVPTWSPNGKWLFIPVEAASRTSPGRSLAIPVGPGESLPSFPPGGIRPGADAIVIPGAQSVDRADIVPGLDISHFAYVNTTVHRNLYRISLP
jgi:DNA-binding winged helix-turn-helix (wHTH) protein/Tol biopolymer transport system component